MVRGLAVSAVLLLLLSSAAVANISQLQSFIVSNDNFVLTEGPDSAAQNTNALTVAQGQLDADRVGHEVLRIGPGGSDRIFSAGRYRQSFISGRSRSHGRQFGP